MLSKDINSVLYKIGNEQCINDPVMVPRFQIKNVPTPYKKKGKEYVLSKKTNGKEFLTSISDLLINGRPIEVSYDAIEYTEVAGGHSSVVTARRWYNGKCQFKIRNSWGKSCALYKSTVDCEEETGSFWVNDEHFAKATLSTTYIE